MLKRRFSILVDVASMCDTLQQWIWLQQFYHVSGIMSSPKRNAGILNRVNVLTVLQPTDMINYAGAAGCILLLTDVREMFL